jgi:hypothetical protein
MGSRLRAALPRIRRASRPEMRSARDCGLARRCLSRGSRSSSPCSTSSTRSSARWPMHSLLLGDGCYLLACLRTCYHIDPNHMSPPVHHCDMSYHRLSVDGRVRCASAWTAAGLRSLVGPPLTECPIRLLPSPVVTLRSHQAAPRQSSAMAAWGSPRLSSFERGGTSVSFGRVISKEPRKISPPIQDEEDLRFTFEAPGGGVDQEKPYWCARCRTTARFLHTHLVRRK